MPSPKLDVEKNPLQQPLHISVALASGLITAADERAAIHAAMRAGRDVLEADGCAFVPFGEWKQSLPVLTAGDFELFQDQNWQDRLSAAPTRHTCRVCGQRQAGRECILLQETSGVENVLCVALRCQGREIGVMSYFFSNHPQTDEGKHRLLADVVHLTDLALERIRLQEREMSALRVDQHTREPAWESYSRGDQGRLEYWQHQAVLDERARLAREIHDGLAQTLAFLKIEAARMQDSLQKGDTGSLQGALSACHRTLSDAYLDARQAIDDLRPVPDEMLSDWLQKIAADFSSLTGIAIKVAPLDLETPFSPAAKAQLTRIVQEALTNIRKHAQASAVSVSAVERQRTAILEIQDNGRGFSQEAVPLERYGLRSMRERAAAIGGEIQIISKPGRGTTIRLQAPVRPGRLHE